jgi:hypothetical protein
MRGGSNASGGAGRYVAGALTLGPLAAGLGFIGHERTPSVGAAILGDVGLDPGLHLISSGKRCTHSQAKRRASGRDAGSRSDACIRRLLPVFTVNPGRADATVICTLEALDPSGRESSTRDSSQGHHPDTSDPAASKHPRAVMDMACSHSQSTPITIRTQPHADLRPGTAARPSDPANPIRDPRLRRAVDRLRGGSDPSSRAGGDAAGGRPRSVKGRAESRPPGRPPEPAVCPIAFAWPSGRYLPN